MRSAHACAAENYVQQQKGVTGGGHDSVGNMVERVELELLVARDIAGAS